MSINSKNKKNKIILLSFIAIVILFLISINLGSIKVELKDLITGLLLNSNDPKVSIIRDIRIPRVLAAIIIGANLGSIRCTFTSNNKKSISGTFYSRDIFGSSL